MIGGVQVVPLPIIFGNRPGSGGGRHLVKSRKAHDYTLDVGLEEKQIDTHTNICSGKIKKGQGRCVSAFVPTTRLTLTEFDEQHNQDHTKDEQAYRR